MSDKAILATRIRDRLSKLSPIREKKMMGGLVFMYHDKMCVGIFKDQLMCRIDPEKQDAALKKKGAALMEFGGRIMNGYIIVADEGIRSDRDFEYWIGLSLDFNKQAKSSRKKKA